MKGETFLGIIENSDGKPGDWDATVRCCEWSSQYVITSCGVYKHAGDHFIRCEKQPDGAFAEPAKDAIGKTIAATRKDDESGVLILFEDGDAVTFELTIVDMSGPMIGTWYTFHKAGNIDPASEYPAEMTVRAE